MQLAPLVQVLESVAPLELAESWDNVGLIIEPLKPRPVRTVLLTIDLTRAVLEEAVALKAGLIIAYHPPLFQGIKRVNRLSREGRLALGALAHNIAVYSPHTALDAAEGGVNDWLCEAFDKADRRSLQPFAEQSPTERFKLVTFLPERHVAAFRTALGQAGVAGVIGHYSECSYELHGHGTFRGDDTTQPAVGQRGKFERIDEVRLEMVCAGGADLQRLSALIEESHPYETPAWDLYRLEPKPQLLRGQGRLLELRKAISLKAALARVKKHLGLAQLRLATAPEADRKASIRRIALCAGAGGSVLSGVPADLYLSGEMRHHDVLAATARGTHVILTEHTNCERGYLPLLALRLGAELPEIDWHVSRVDRDPLQIV